MPSQTTDTQKPRRSVGRRARARRRESFRAFFLAGGIAAFMLGAAGVLASQALSGTQRIVAGGVAFVPALIFVCWWLFGPGLKGDATAPVELPDAVVAEMPAVEAALTDVDGHANPDIDAPIGNRFRLHPMRDPSRIDAYRATIRRPAGAAVIGLRPRFRAGNE